VDLLSQEYGIKEEGLLEAFDTDMSDNMKHYLDSLISNATREYKASPALLQQLIHANRPEKIDQDYYPILKQQIIAANVIVLGTPDYHGSISSTLKNFLDHFWKEFAGKLFATVVASHEKGLTVHDQLRTVARQCYAWVMPYGVSFMEKVDVKNGQVASDELRSRLEMLQHDIQVYGRLLANQRAADLAGTAPGFLAQLRQ